jgi:aspartokinase/homoserine dehydrogenase 1
VAVVTCNKIVRSSALKTIKILKVYHEGTMPFLFETNVGAGLPIIDTVKKSSRIRR